MFSAFIGIDWSGARGARQPGIQIAMARPGRATPETLLADDGRHWGREGVRDRLVAEAAAAGGPVLAGIDFAFAHPFHDEGAYYPGLAASPADAPALWRMVEAICGDDLHL